MLNCCYWWLSTWSLILCVLVTSEQKMPGSADRSACSHSSEFCYYKPLEGFIFVIKLLKFHSGKYGPHLLQVGQNRSWTTQMRNEVLFITLISSERMNLYYVQLFQ
jgi:hypothetical protein